MNLPAAEREFRLCRALRVALRETETMPRRWVVGGIARSGRHPGETEEVGIVASWTIGTGFTVEKRVQGPPGGPDHCWTAIMVDLDDGNRATVLLEPRDVNKVAIGDYVQFEYRPGEEPRAGWFGRKGVCRNLQLLKPSRPFDGE